MGGFETLREQAAALLRQQGVHAVLAMEAVPQKRWDGPVAAVSLSRVACGSGGFRDYLGTETDPATGSCRELYGRSVELTVALDIYAPRDGGESACRTAMADLTEAVVCHGLGGLAVEEVTAGSVEFLERDGLYRLPVRCLCKGWLVAREEADGAFVDIEVRGRKI